MLKSSGARLLALGVNPVAAGRRSILFGTLILLLHLLSGRDAQRR